MKKIHLTESQVKYIKHILKEIDAKKTSTIVADTDVNGNITQQSLTSTKNKLNSMGMGDSTIAVDPKRIEENYNCYTKKQLKEARLNKLRKESTSYTKKNFMK